MEEDLYWLKDMRPLYRLNPALMYMHVISVGTLNGSENNLACSLKCCYEY